MADPQTPTIAIYQPTRGSYVGTWDLPVNFNSGAIDSLFGNVAAVGLASSSPVTLTTPPNIASAWAGPYQSQSALIRCTGTITTDIGLIFPRAGYYIIENLCLDTSGRGAGSVAGSSSILAGNGAGGKTIGIPPGKKCHIFSDGTDLDWVNMPDVGTAYDLHGVTALPRWMTIGTQKQPYLIKDGSTYNVSAYPVLSGMLGNTFGGSPGVTFGVPDERARMRMAYDPNGTGRVNSTVNAGTMGSAGGAQALNSINQIPQFSYTPTGTIGGSFAFTCLVSPGSPLTGVGSSGGSQIITVTGSSFSFNGNAVSFGNPNPSQALPPTIVSFLALIKT